MKPTKVDTNFERKKKKKKPSHQPGAPSGGDPQKTLPPQAKPWACGRQGHLAASRLQTQEAQRVRGTKRRTAVLREPEHPRGGRAEAGSLQQKRCPREGGSLGHGRASFHPPGTQ